MASLALSKSVYGSSNLSVPAKFLFYGTLMVSGLPVKQVYGLKPYGGSSPPCRAIWVCAGAGEPGRTVNPLPSG